MLTSSRRSISYPNPDNSDSPEVPLHIGHLVDALEVDVVYAQGTNATRIARAHLAGTVFWVTDIPGLWYDDGTTWQQISAGGNLQGTLASRPSASAVPAGTVYRVTDDNANLVYRSDGSAWKLWSSPAGAIIDYVTVTSNVVSTGGSLGAADTVIVSDSVTLEASTNYLVEYQCPQLSVSAATTVVIVFVSDSTVFFNLASISLNASTTSVPVYLRTIWTPGSGSHSCTIKSFVSGGAGATFHSAGGGSGIFTNSNLVIRRW
jgi:hypothetical protein